VRMGWVMEESKKKFSRLGLGSTYLLSILIFALDILYTKMFVILFHGYDFVLSSPGLIMTWRLLHFMWK
jgi:hypothetical protein